MTDTLTHRQSDSQTDRGPILQKDYLTTDNLIRGKTEEKNTSRQLESLESVNQLVFDLGIQMIIPENTFCYMYFVKYLGTLARLARYWIDSLLKTELYYLAS